MEPIKLTLKNDQRWDEIIETSGSYIVPETGGLEIVTRESSSDGGRPATMITFGMIMPDKTIRRVHVVTTPRMFIEAGEVLRAAHGIS